MPGLYVKAFDDDIIPDTETLSLTYLPDRVHWQARSWVSLKGARRHKLFRAK